MPYGKKCDTKTSVANPHNIPQQEPEASSHVFPLEWRQRLMIRACGQSSEANQNGGDGNKCLELNIEFVVGRSYAAKQLQASKESFNEIAAILSYLSWIPDSL